MNALRCLQLVGALLALTVGLAAQVVTVPPISAKVGYARKVTISITLGQTPFLESILPFPYPPPSPVNVAPGSDVEIFTPFSDAELASIIWLRLGSTVSNTGNSLKISGATAEDSGSYGANVKLTNGTSWTSDFVTIRVVAPARQQLLNLSSRAMITPSNPMLTSGFVIAPNAGHLKESKTLLIRMVGPSLAKFGVANPLAHPVIKIFDQAGTEVQQARADVWLGYNATTIAAKVGAFALLPGSSDVAELLTIPAGVYTAQVTSGDGTSGDVLLEIYEVAGELLTF